MEGKAVHKTLITVAEVRGVTNDCTRRGVTRGACSRHAWASGGRPRAGLQAFTTPCTLRPLPSAGLRARGFPQAPRDSESLLGGLESGMATGTEAPPVCFLGRGLRLLSHHQADLTPCSGNGPPFSIPV